MSNEQKPKRPTYAAYQVGEGENARFVKIGAAWPNKDKKGFNLVLDAFPLNGRIVLREINEREAETGGDQ